MALHRLFEPKMNRSFYFTSPQAITFYVIKSQPCWLISLEVIKFPRKKQLTTRKKQDKLNYKQEVKERVIRDWKRKTKLVFIPRNFSLVTILSIK